MKYLKDFRGKQLGYEQLVKYLRSQVFFDNWYSKKDGDSSFSDFSGAVITGAEIDEQTMSFSRLEDYIVRDLDFSGALVCDMGVNLTFSNCSLNGTFIDNAWGESFRIVSASEQARGCIISRVDCSLFTIETRGDSRSDRIEAITLQGCRSSEARIESLEDSAIHKCKMSLELIGSGYGDCSIEDCTFRNSELRKSDFWRTRFTTTTIRDTKIEDCYFDRCVFTSVNFEGCDFKNVRFERCIFLGGSFFRGSAQNVEFKDCTFGAGQKYPKPVTDSVWEGLLV